MDKSIQEMLIQDIVSEYISILDEKVKTLYYGAMEICTIWDCVNDEEFKLADRIVSVFENRAAEYKLGQNLSK